MDKTRCIKLDAVANAGVKKCSVKRSCPARSVGKMSRSWKVGTTDRTLRRITRFRTVGSSCSHAHWMRLFWLVGSGKNDPHSAISSRPNRPGPMRRANVWRGARHAPRHLLARRCCPDCGGDVLTPQKHHQITLCDGAGFPRRPVRAQILSLIQHRGPITVKTITDTQTGSFANNTIRAEQEAQILTVVEDLEDLGLVAKGKGGKWQALTVRQILYGKGKK